jgi:hypothetical protein
MVGKASLLQILAEVVVGVTVIAFGFTVKVFVTLVAGA